MPLVSIIMPVHQAAGFLHQAVATVQAQTLPDWEICAVEDGSTDDSWAVLAALAQAEPRIRPHRMPARGGPGPARNAALDMARGRYMAFLDADDLWHPDKLARQLGWMARRGHALTCTAFVRAGMTGPSGPPIGVAALITRAMLLKTNVMTCSTVVYDRERLGARHMPTIPRRQDFAFWLRLLQDTDAHGLSEVLATIRARPGSVSAPRFAAARATWGMYRQTVGLSWTEAAQAYAHYAWRGVWRRAAPGLARHLGYVHPAWPAGTLPLD